MKTTNIFYRALCLVLMALCSVFASGQTLEYDIDFPQYTPKSPTAYSFAKYVDYPVSYYTGVPNISIPLYEISVGGLNIPISLSYHASGITASQEATRVGLGWNLNAGGVISRTVKCGDDFQEHASPNGLAKGYFETPEAKEPISNADFFWSGQESRLKGDSEPDLFFYSLPGGGSGKFVFGKDSIPVLFNHDGSAEVKLVQADSKVGTFEIRTSDGTLYVFDKKEDTYSFGRNLPLNLNGTATGASDITSVTDINDTFDDPFEYVSGWYLSKIVSHTNDTVTFDYEREYYQLPVQESAVMQNLLSSYSSGSSAPFWEGTGVRYTSNKTVINTWRLSQISWRGGHVAFEFTDRDDLIKYSTGDNPKKVSAVKVYDKTGSLVRNYGLEYDYFISSSMNYNYAHVYKRLKLQKVTDYLAPGADWNFGYISGELPGKNTKNTDYWGYYNGSSQGAAFYCPTVYEGKTYSGGNKESNFQYMKAGTLETITQPTGGQVKFTYEANKYADNAHPVLTSHSVYLCVYRGLQDEDYSEYPQTDCDTVTFSKETTVDLYMFFAHAGNGTNDPNSIYGNSSYPVFTVSRLENGLQNRLYSYPIPAEFAGNKQYSPANWNITLPAGTYIFGATSVADNVYCEWNYSYQDYVMTPGQEKTGGGLRVKKIEGERTVTYTYEDGVMTVPPVYSYLLTKTGVNSANETATATYLMQTSEASMPLTSLKGGNIFGYGTITEKFQDGTESIHTFHNEAEETPDYPFLPTTIDYFNGLPESVITHDAAGNRVKEEEYVYSSSSPGKIVYGFVFRNYEETHPYHYSIQWPYLSFKRVTETNAGTDRVTTWNYTRNSHMQPAMEVMDDGMDTYTVRYKYTTDMTGEPYTTMSAKYMVGVPVESLSLKDGSVVAGKKTTYTATGSMVLPFSESLLKTSEPLTLENYSDSLEVRLQYSNYNAYGQPMQSAVDGENRVYLWSYNGLYPVAEIRNATYSQVSGALGSGFITTLLGKSVPTDSDITAIRALQTSLDDVEVTTYRYQPLVGVTEMTDCRGVTTGFTYDSAGRLADTWRKADGVTETLSTYEYNYAE